MNTKPYPFQEEDAGELANNFKGRGLISHEMGMGKSLTSLLACQLLKASPVIIVCPASLKWNWEREAKVHFGLRAVVLEGTCPPADRGFPVNAKLVIINYDILGPWLRWLRKLKPQAIILDESHFIASRYAQRSRNCRKLCRKVPNVILLSGTPLVNRPSELWHQMHLLHPKIFTSFWSWARRFCAPRRTHWGWDVRGASNLPRLRKLLKKWGVIRRRKVDVLKDLPPKSRSVVPVPLTRPKEYRRAVKDFLGWLAEKKPEKLRKAMMAEQLVKWSYLKQLAAELSMGAKIDWINTFLKGTDEKLIVFAVHRKVVEAIRKRFENVAVKVDGSVTGRKRQQAVDRFVKHPGCRLFVGNRAAEVGWSAKGIPNVAHVELPWAPGSVTQRGDRAHGIGRGKVGVVTREWFLVAKGTVEEKLAQILQRKQGVFRSVLDGKGKGDRLNVFDLLEKELKKGTHNAHEGTSRRAGQRVLAQGQRQTNGR